jgi:hypothetical protein
LNKLWNAFFQHRRRKKQLTEGEIAQGRSDSQALRELLLTGMSEEQGSEFCQSENVRRFAELSPPIMNHDTLLREEYDPFNISEKLQKRASDEHRQLLNAYRRHCSSLDDPALRKTLLKKIGQLVFIVRSNIAHSEKTPRGPDLAKAERDRVVSEITSGVIEQFFDVLFDRPSGRLAVYGSLSPGAPNASKLDEVEGEWHQGVVHGLVQRRDGFLEFRWTLDGAEVPVRMISSSRLKAHFEQLDRFEGPRYERILVPVAMNGPLSVSNIYQGKNQASAK